MREKKTKQKMTQKATITENISKDGHKNWFKQQHEANIGLMLFPSWPHIVRCVELGARVGG